MDSTDTIQHFRRRAWRHAYEDGAADLVVGLYALMLALATQRRAFLAISVVYLGVMSGLWRHLHLRLTAPRTGYAELEERPPERLLLVTLLSGLLTLGLVTALSFGSGGAWGQQPWPAWTPLVAGPVLAGGLAHTAWRTGLERYWRYAGAALAAALMGWRMPLDPRVDERGRLTLTLLAVAGVLLLGGLLAVVRFLRRHPAAAEEAPGGR